MKAEELRGKTSDQLKEQLLDLKKEQFNLRSGHGPAREHRAGARGQAGHRQDQDGSGC